MKKLVLALGIVSMAGAVSAALPPIWSVAPHFRTMDGLSYQFRGTTSGGQPVADGPHVVGFAIFDDATAGTSLWSESQTITTANGLGDAHLGSVVPIPLDVFGNGSDTAEVLYLQVTLDGEPILPRTRLVPAPYAHIAERLMGDVVTGPAAIEILNPGGLTDTIVHLGLSSTKAETVHLHIKSNGENVDVSPSGMHLVGPAGDTAASYGKENIVLNNIGSSGEDGVSVELKVDRDSTGDLEARMTYYGLVDVSRPRTSKPKEIVVVGSKVKEVVRFYENDTEDEVADRDYVSGRATGVRRHSPFRVTGAALPDTVPGYELRVDSGGTDIMVAKNNTDGTSTWLEVLSDTGGTSLRMNKADLIDNIASASMSVDGDGSSTGVVYSDPGVGILKSGIIQADSSGSGLVISNIGSSGEDGVSIAASDGTTEVKLGIEHEDIGGSFHASDDGTGAGLILFDISATGDTGRVQLQAHELGHNLDIGNLGSSGQDGFSVAVNTEGASVTLLDSMGDSAIVITTKQQTGGPTRGSKLFVGDLSWDGDYDLTLDGSIGIGVSDPANILEVQRNSATDPIADAWTIYSSRRWKENIRTIDNAVDRVEQLRGVTFDWKADGKHDVGLIAEEVGEVIPEVVSFEENGVDARSVDYSRLVALLIEAAKEQQATIDQLKQTNGNLETRLAELEKLARAMADSKPPSEVGDLTLTTQ